MISTAYQQVVNNPLVLAYVAGLVTGAMAYRRLVRFTLGGRP